MPSPSLLRRKIIIKNKKKHHHHHHKKAVSVVPDESGVPPTHQGNGDIGTTHHSHQVLWLSFFNVKIFNDGKILEILV